MVEGFAEGPLVVLGGGRFMMDKAPLYLALVVNA